MAIDWRSAAGMPAEQLQAVLLDEAERVMAGLSAGDEDQQLASLAEPLRAIWLPSWLDFEVSQGSLLAYFFNSHGRHAVLAIEVLRRMGAGRLADVLAEAERSHRMGAAEWTARRQDSSSLGEFAVVHPYEGLPNAAELGELTDRYWEAADLDDWGAKLDVYLQEQVASLASAST